LTINQTVQYHDIYISEVIPMPIKITGYYKLPNSLEPKLVDFNEVFHTSFMRKFTRYKSFEKFLNGGKFAIKCQQDFEALPEIEMDQHVLQSTKFKSWQEMLDYATDKYILKQ